MVPFAPRRWNWEGRYWEFGPHEEKLRLSKLEKS
jgi:hypothetical protein